MKFNLLVLINLAAIASTGKSLPKVQPGAKDFKNIVEKKCKDSGSKIRDVVEHVEFCGESVKESINFPSQARPYICLLTLNMIAGACDEQVDLSQMEKTSNETICPLNLSEFKNQFENSFPELRLSVGAEYFADEDACKRVCGFDEKIRDSCALMSRIYHIMKRHTPAGNGSVGASAPASPVAATGVDRGRKNASEAEMQNPDAKSPSRSNPPTAVHDVKTLPAAVENTGKVPDLADPGTARKVTEGRISTEGEQATKTNVHSTKANMSKSTGVANNTIGSNNHFSNMLKTNASNSNYGEEKMTNPLKVTEAQMSRTEPLATRDETEGGLDAFRGLGDETSSQNYNRKDSVYNSPIKGDEDEDDNNNNNNNNDDDLSSDDDAFEKQPKAAQSQENERIFSKGRTQMDKSSSYKNEFFNGDSFFQTEDSHFSAYFFMTVSIIIIGYVIYHNKNKIVAFALEGRRSRNGRRRPHSSASYRKLDCNLEEAIASNPSHASVTNVVY